MFVDIFQSLLHSTHSHMHMLCSTLLCWWNYTNLTERKHSGDIFAHWKLTYIFSHFTLLLCWRISCTIVLVAQRRKKYFQESKTEWWKLTKFRLEIFDDEISRSRKLFIVGGGKFSGKLLLNDILPFVSSAECSSSSLILSTIFYKAAALLFFCRFISLNNFQLFSSCLPTLIKLFFCLRSLFRQLSPYFSGYHFDLSRWASEHELSGCLFAFINFPMFFPYKTKLYGELRKFFIDVFFFFWVWVFWDVEFFFELTSSDFSGNFWKFSLSAGPHVVWRRTKIFDFSLLSFPSKIFQFFNSSSLLFWDLLSSRCRVDWIKYFSNGWKWF